MSVLNKPIAQFFGWFDSLDSKEKKLVAFLMGGVCLGLVLVVFLWVSGSISAKQIKLKSEKANLAQILALESQYRTAKQIEIAKKRKFRFNTVSLFSLMQGVANSLDLNLKDLNEQKIPVAGGTLVEYSVVVNLTKLSIDKLSAFLRGVEETQAVGLVKVTKLKVKSRFDDPELLDVQMTVSTWKSS